MICITDFFEKAFLREQACEKGCFCLPIRVLQGEPSLLRLNSPLRSASFLYAH